MRSSPYYLSNPTVVYVVIIPVEWYRYRTGTGTVPELSSVVVLVVAVVVVVLRSFFFSGYSYSTHLNLTENQYGKTHLSKLTGSQQTSHVTKPLYVFR